MWKTFRQLAEGNLITLFLMIEERNSPLCFKARVKSINGKFGEAELIGLKGSEKFKVFEKHENFEQYKGRLINFSLSDIISYADDQDEL